MPFSTTATALTCQLPAVRASRPQIGDRGVAAFAKAAAPLSPAERVASPRAAPAPFAALFRLDLAANPIRDDGVAAFALALREASCAALPALQSIEMGGELTDRGLMVMAGIVDDELLGELEEVRVGENPAASAAAREAFAETCRRRHVLTWPRDRGNTHSAATRARPQEHERSWGGFLGS